MLNFCASVTAIFVPFTILFMLFKADSDVKFGRIEAAIKSRGDALNALDDALKARGDAIKSQGDMLKGTADALKAQGSMLTAQGGMLAGVALLSSLTLAATLFSLMRQ